MLILYMHHKYSFIVFSDVYLRHPYLSEFIAYLFVNLRMIKSLNYMIYSYTKILKCVYDICLGDLFVWGIDLKSQLWLPYVLCILTITLHFFLWHSWSWWCKGFNSNYCCSQSHVHSCWNEGKFWISHGLQDTSPCDYLAGNLLQHLWPCLSCPTPLM